MTDAQRFDTSDGLSLAYRDEGAGQPVLCLAGLTRNMADFQTIADRHADRARILRLDSRGRGASDRDPDYRNYTVAREAQDALELLDHLGLDRVSILGTSRGGLIAMALAATAKTRLRGVFLNDIGPVIEPAGLDAIADYLGRRPGHADYDTAADALVHAMADRFPGVSRAAWRAHAERLWFEAPDGLDLRYDPALRRAVLEAMEAGTAPDLWPFFDALADLPLAAVRGANSDLLSPETFAEMRRRRPDALWAEVPDRGHVPFLDEPAATATLTAFLERTREH